MRMILQEAVTQSWQNVMTMVTYCHNFFSATICFRFQSLHIKKKKVSAAYIFAMYFGPLLVEFFQGLVDHLLKLAAARVLTLQPLLYTLHHYSHSQLDFLLFIAEILK